MNNSGNSRSQPPRAIRAGLSVQELKAMTAARIAQSGEPQPRIQQYNPATSYQTANPQQLQAAGITPIVINDRSRTLRNFRPNSLSSIELEPLQTTSHANLPHPSSRNGLSQLSPYHQQILPRRSPPQDHAHGPRDTYYNSNSSTHFEGSDNHLWNQRSPVRDFPSSHSERLENSLFGGGKSLSSRNENVFGSFEPHTDLTPRTPGGLLPALNTSPRYVRGPEVRSPATGERPVADRYFIPDEESEHYSMDSLFSSLNLGPSATSSENLNFGSKKVPLSRALSNPVIQPEGGSFTLPHAGAHVISSSFLPSVSPVQNGNVFPQSQVDNGRSDNLAYDEPNESGNSKFLEPARFPFKKSKTAPKLGIISSAGINSPVDSPSVKIFARKHAGHPVNLSPLRDRTSLDSNFLASEVAEAVLDTPSTGSTPLGRKFFPQDAIPALRKGFSNSSIQPIDLTPESTKGYFANGSFYGASAVRDDRLEWSISDPVEDNPQFHVSNQCESDDTEDRVIERSLRPDSTENRLHRRIIHAGTNRNLPSLDQLFLSHNLCEKMNQVVMYSKTYSCLSNYPEDQKQK